MNEEQDNQQEELKKEDKAIDQKTADTTGKTSPKKTLDQILQKSIVDP